MKTFLSDACVYDSSFSFTFTEVIHLLRTFKERFGFYLRMLPSPIPCLLPLLSNQKHVKLQMKLFKTVCSSL